MLKRRAVLVDESVAHLIRGDLIIPDFGDRRIVLDGSLVVRRTAKKLRPGQETPSVINDRLVAKPSFPVCCFAQKYGQPAHLTWVTSAHLITPVNPGGSQSPIT